MEVIESISRIVDWNKNDLQRENRYVYRGMSDINYDLIPKISRKWDSDNEDNVVSSEEAIRRFQKLQEYLTIRLPAYNYDFHHLDIKPRKWKELFIGQHYGAPTSLLDFTRNPLAGLFFACISNPKKDGVLYGICIKSQERFSGREFNPDAQNYNIASYDLISTGNNGKAPEDLLKHKFIVPPHFDPRIQTQQSVFCSFPIEKLTTPLNDQISENYEGGQIANEGKMDHIMKWKIPKNKKKEILQELNWIGINYSTLFPDINGFGDYTSWRLMAFES